MTKRNATPSLMIRATIGLALATPIACMLAFSPPAAAQQSSERVAAVVNEDAISIRDLEMRIKMVLLSSSLPDTVENRSRVGGQVLRKLIDERLELQEAEHKHINVVSGEINNGVANIERQNNMPAGAMDTLLKGKGIDPDTLRQQIKAEIAWARTVRRELMPEIKIGEEEIDTRLQTLRENLGKPEYLAADIYLPIDNPAHQAEVEALANRLIDQLRQGAPFSALARQFSQTGGASGGDLGWVSEGMLDDDLMSTLGTLTPGTASQPIHSIDGIHILLLRDKRIVGQQKSEPTFDLSIVNLTTLPSATAAERDDQVRRLREATNGLKSCDDFPRALKAIPSADWVHPGKARPSEIPREVLTLLDNLPMAQLSQPLSMADGKRFYVICGRNDPDPSGLPSRDEVRQRLEDERLEVLARRYMRDIRRSAFVEFRI
ncbi:MAG TPA: peptidylprolyl isomerase [Candidatus Sulfotelmatobacter sp.]|jgi:peptidyl-prolyl cis-trans isomerase SurA|nr:peptidylprolyl isomerase [Candidatus Sulfotelmatobacter sp.]